MKDPRKFWSVEYIDDEGDLVTTNILATQEEVEAALKEFAKRKVTARIHEVSHPAVNSPDALSF